MPSLDACQLLDISESGRHMGIGSRAALILQTALPQWSHDAIMALNLSACDRLLWGVRRATFGHGLRARQSCIACGENFELDLDAGQLGFERDENRTEPLIELNGQPVRALTLADIVAVERIGSAELAAQLLADRIFPGGDIDIDKMSEALEAADPDADISLIVRCPDCATDQELLFDLADFFWEEITARSPRILREVADLARAFHWSERDILAMSSRRRSYYLGMA